MEPTKQHTQPLKAVVETKTNDKKVRKEAKVTLKVPRMEPTKQHTQPLKDVVEAKPSDKKVRKEAKVIRKDSNHNGP